MYFVLGTVYYSLDIISKKGLLKFGCCIFDVVVVVKNDCNPWLGCPLAYIHPKSKPCIFFYHIAIINMVQISRGI